ncbi:MAG: malto-oligosyltrehalose synthase [Betaproteobacteria bacterium]
MEQRVDPAEIAPGYVDAWGQRRDISPRTREALAKALGAPSRKAKPQAAVGRCHLPEHLERGGRVWGFMLQLYGIRSERNWGIGDFTDLRRLIERSASLGASVVGVNPLHATLGSPYSPNSRHALNPLYIDVEAVPGFDKSMVSPALRRRIRALREAALVDYEGVAAAKLQVLEQLFVRTKTQTGEALKKSPPRRRGSSFSLNNMGSRFRGNDYSPLSRGVPSRFAVYEALREKFGYGWQGWPREYRDPGSAEVKRFAARNANRVAFHDFLQAVAREQLDLAQQRAHELGMPAGLYVDLALGADRRGAEVWSNQRGFALDVSCGAPPDEFNPIGQDWGLPPYSPRALRDAGYKPFAQLLAANMPEGGALRMDHVMALSRLWWVPKGAKADEGGYVSYDFEPMLAILAAQSRRKRCAVIGEDLGTVPPELRAALSAAHVLSYRPLIFERAFPPEALVCVSTHDLPTWRGFWASQDLKLRRSLGLTRDPGREQAARDAELEKLRHLGLDDNPLSAHAFIARTPSMIALLQPEDVFDLVEQANLPGTTGEHPNWRRKLPLTLERWKGDARVQASARAMAERGVAPRRPLRAPDATYRVQLHKGFRFADATKLVPYLAKLGISHLYSSPFLKARPGSTHGYDVIDHNAVNPEIGSEKELRALLDTLKKHGMGMVADLVPNHMGVLHADNAWWLDVLANGPASPHARFFDIDWSRGKLLLPVLGRHYGAALETGELKVDLAKNCLRYFDHRFPLSSKSLRGVKRPPRGALEVHKLLEQQHYRLAYWRVASDEINYRRFFEITELAGVRIEDRTVFEATHGLIRRLAQSGGIDGLRVDHPDGLADPEQYFERLGELSVRPWVIAEKILADHETLHADWALHGTTGYDFANLLSGLFVDAAAEARFERIYARFTGDGRRFAEIARESRLLIMDTTLAADLHMLSNWLARIASGNRFTRDYTASGLRKALAAIAAHFPVYRTYVTPRGVSDADRRTIDWAVKAARRASHFADASVFDFVQSVLTLDAAPQGGARREEMARFAMRFQQFTAPVVAKGVEDTAFYRYNRFIALNEVGGNPGRFGVSLKAFHAAGEARAKRWPYSMLGTSTHDTKRSEDARARLAALSEAPGLWRMALGRWSVLNRSHRTEIAWNMSGQPAPSRADEIHYYQALIAVWPGDSPEGLAARLKAYMLKAAREAKLHTSWINADAEYEAALERFVGESLANPLFQRDLEETLPRLVRAGELIGLSQALLKVASPGIPDYYQGTELWDYSLVDPDNRRPVDYAQRRRLLDSSSHPKLNVIRKGLEVRRRMPALFHGGQYEALYAGGGREENIVAFSLSSAPHRVVALAPRLFSRLMHAEDRAPLGERVWGEADIDIPAGRYENVLTGERHEGGPVPLARLLSSFPVALLVSD